MSDTNHNGSSLFPGFLFGAILGGGIVFLLGTKKGKKLLQTLTEEGFEGMSEVEDLIEEAAEDYDESEIINNPVVAAKEGKIPDSNIHKDQDVEEKSSGVKRFFRGIRKKT